MDVLSAMSTVQTYHPQPSSAMESLSSGQRINTAADDAAGLAISEGLNSDARGHLNASSNAQAGINMLRTAEGGLDRANDLLQRMKELSVRSNNGALGDSGKQALQAEFSQLAEEFGRVAKTTSFADTKLLDGSAGVQSFQVGSEGTASDVAQVNLEPATMTTIAESLAGVHLPTGDPLSISQTLDKALADISSGRAELGAQENRLTSAAKSEAYAAETSSGSYSRIRDADVASQVMQMSRDEVLNSAKLSLQAQAGSMNSQVAQHLLRM